MIINGYFIPRRLEFLDDCKRFDVYAHFKDDVSEYCFISSHSSSKGALKKLKRCMKMCDYIRGYVFQPDKNASVYYTL